MHKNKLMSDSCAMDMRLEKVWKPLLNRLFCFIRLIGMLGTTSEDIIFVHFATATLKQDLLTPESLDTKNSIQWH